MHAAAENEPVGDFHPQFFHNANWRKSVVLPAFGRSPAANPLKPLASGGEDQRDLNR
jgi:hypothetical protein